MKFIICVKEDSIMKKLQSVFSQELYTARTRLNYTQAQVAEAVSISIRWYQRLEKGLGEPSFPVAMSLVALLGIDTQVLLKAISLINVPVSSH